MLKKPRILILRNSISLCLYVEFRVLFSTGLIFYFNYEEFPLHTQYIHVSISNKINRSVDRINFNNFEAETKKRKWETYRGRENRGIMRMHVIMSNFT